MGKWACFGTAAALWLGLTVPGYTGEPPATAADSSSERWSELTPIVTDKPFRNVRYPHRDNLWDVTFIADDTSTGVKGGNHGIYRYGSDEKLVCLVHAGETTVPGKKATITLIRGLQIDTGPVGLEQNSVPFVFNAYDSADKRGLYLWSAGKLQTVARTGTTILPGEEKPITAIEYGALHGERLLYQATAPDQGSVLVLHDLRTGNDRVLCHGGMSVPGPGVDEFRSIASQNWLDNGSIVFRATSAKPDAPVKPREAMGIYGWFGVKDWSAESAELAPERLRTLVNANTDVPIPEVSADAAFDTINSAPVGGDTVVFEAEGDGFRGVFCVKVSDSSVRCIVSNHTNFGGPAKGHFTGFGGFPTVQNKDVIFTARATENRAGGANRDDAAATYAGVFDYRLDSGELFALADNRFPLAGKKIDFFEIAGHFGCGDHFAVAATFEDRSSQILLGTIPQKFFRRILGDHSAEPEPGR